MKFQVYFVLGTSLSCFPGLALGQCIPVQDCAALGYTASSCNGGKGVKCPFGNGWFCAEGESTVCAENGFKYSCTGTGYAGGAGFACGGKYTQCTCASGYEWKDWSCQKQVLNGAQGDLYYCNGVVVGVKTSSMNFYIAVNDIGQTEWFNTKYLASNYVFCGNLKGTLPYTDQLLIIYQNKSSINDLLSANGGTKLSDSFYWADDGSGNANQVRMSDGYVLDYWSSQKNYTRPVLASY